jgi:hypothetical protein
MVRVRVRILLTNMKNANMCTGLGIGLGLVENNIIRLTGLFKSTLTVTLTQNITLTL